MYLLTLVLAPRTAAHALCLAVTVDPMSVLSSGTVPIVARAVVIGRLGLRISETAGAQMRIGLTNIISFLCLCTAPGAIYKFLLNRRFPSQSAFH
ncbi:hypothetical protein BGY98DRAFT_1010840 [Russula aff. rugulosa BPL654]|nr:hypothetical protein BGY98DRAFT_1010840 [Russula aff. rugulosa BPL654]